MENPIISVIIPIYNDEKYIRQCLDSALSQTLREIEVLCIDDASTDGTPGILAEYAKRDDRVKVITNSTNIKADASRNLAIDAARGEFLCFIDSDDFLPDPDMFASLTAMASREHLDLVMFQAKHFLERDVSDSVKSARRELKSPSEFDPSLCGRVMSGGEMLDLALKLRNHNCYIYIWMRLYRTSLIRGTGLRFREGGNFADMLFTPLAMLLAKRARAVDHIYYMRRIHEKSVTTSTMADPDAMRRWFLEVKEIIFTWKSEKTQSIVAASGSRSANNLVNHQLQHLGLIFSQLSDDAAQRELDAFENTPDNQIINTHLTLIRQLSSRVRQLSSTEEELRRSVGELRESVEKQNASAKEQEEFIETLKTKVQKLKAKVTKLRTKVQKLKPKIRKLKAKVAKLKAKVAKLKKMCKLRGKRPNSIRACVKFMLRRLVGRK